MAVTERFEFLLDTGATKCVIPKETARAYEMEPIRKASGIEAAERVSTANGSILVRVVKAESMSIANSVLSVEGPIESGWGTIFFWE